jgi:GNAT superfamily N-acetyltransferase
MAPTIRPLDAAVELAAFLAVSNQPDTTPLSEADWREGERRRPGRHLVAEDAAGRIAAIATMRDSEMTTGAAEVRLVVDRGRRGRGVGRTLAAAVEEQLRSTAGAAVITFVRDDDTGSRAWAERRGFAVFDHTFESRLDLTRFDAAPHRWAVERAAEAGLAIEPCQDGERLHELVVALLPDVPAAALSTPSRAEFQRTVVDRAGTFSLVARDGETLVGLAIVVRSGTDGAWNWLTGVRPAYRGHGLARALKVAAAEEARRRGRRWLGAQNNAVNAPMLAVNDALGFRREAAGLLWLRRGGA